MHRGALARPAGSGGSRLERFGTNFLDLADDGVDELRAGGRDGAARRLPGRGGPSTSQGPTRSRAVSSRSSRQQAPLACDPKPRASGALLRTGNARTNCTRSEWPRRVPAADGRVVTATSTYRARSSRVGASDPAGPPDPSAEPGPGVAARHPAAAGRCGVPAAVDRPTTKPCSTMRPSPRAAVTTAAVGADRSTVSGGSSRR